MNIEKRSIVILFVFFLSCGKNIKTVTKVENMYSKIKKELAPDKRTELFDIQFHLSNGALILKGKLLLKRPFQDYKTVLNILK